MHNKVFSNTDQPSGCFYTANLLKMASARVFLFVVVSKVLRAQSLGGIVVSDMVFSAR